jgi:hypothetical protein
VESAQEVRYSGVVVGRGVPVRERDASGAFVVLAEPLPVGTRITLRGEGDDVEARVTAVTESANPDLAGVRIAFVSAEGPRAPAGEKRPPEKPPSDKSPVREPPPDAEVRKAPVVEPPPPAPAKPPVIEEPRERETPPVVETRAASTPATADGAPTEVPTSDSTASAAMPVDPGMGGGKRRRRRR